jgi:hypothetical protein
MDKKKEVLTKLQQLCDFLERPRFFNRAKTDKALDALDFVLANAQLLDGVSKEERRKCPSPKDVSKYGF